MATKQHSCRRKSPDSGARSFVRIPGFGRGRGVHRASADSAEPSTLHPQGPDGKAHCSTSTASASRPQEATVSKSTRTPRSSSSTFCVSRCGQYASSAAVVNSAVAVANSAVAVASSVAVVSSAAAKAEKG